MPVALDLTGERFGRLVALQFHDFYYMPSTRMRRWWCRCDCGTELPVLVGSLRDGNTQSCGCYNLDRLSDRATHGLSGTPVHKVWKGMLQRCSNPAYTQYKDYGGRGITVCDRWRIFERFFEDMGDRPSNKHTLERVENSGNYTPDNCAWVTRTVQNRNQRMREDNKSGVGGVGFHLRIKKWQAFMSQNGKRIHLGYYDTIEEAAQARKTAVLNAGYNPNHGISK